MPRIDAVGVRLPTGVAYAPADVAISCKHVKIERDDEKNGYKNREVFEIIGTSFPPLFGWKITAKRTSCCKIMEEFGVMSFLKEKDEPSMSRS